MATAGYTALADVWSQAGSEVIAQAGADPGGASGSLAEVTMRLSHALAASWGSWGRDAIGEAFENGQGSQPGFGKAADNLLTAMAQMVNIMASAGWQMQVSGVNYAAAEHASTIGAGKPTPVNIPEPATYKLPAVSKSLTPTDPPPPEYMYIIGLLESMAGGCQYPDGNFAMLGQVAAALTAASRQVKSLVETLEGSQQCFGLVAAAGNAGDAASAFTSYAKNVISGLEWIQQQCVSLASSASNCLAQKHAARITFWASLTFLAVMLAASAAMSWFTFGGSLGVFFGCAEAEAGSLADFLAGVLRAVVEGMAFSAGDDAISQFARMHEGLQGGFDWAQLAEQGGVGAASGLLMIGLGMGMGMGMGMKSVLGGGLTKAFSEDAARKVLGLLEDKGIKGAGARLVFNGLAGTTANVAVQAATDDGHVDLASAVSSGFGMAVIGEGHELPITGPKVRAVRAGGVSIPTDLGTPPPGGDDDVQPPLPPSPSPGADPLPPGFAVSQHMAAGEMSDLASLTTASARPAAAPGADGDGTPLPLASSHTLTSGGASKDAYEIATGGGSSGQDTYHAATGTLPAGSTPAAGPRDITTPAATGTPADTGSEGPGSSPRRIPGSPPAPRESPAGPAPERGTGTGPPSPGASGGGNPQLADLDTSGRTGNPVTPAPDNAGPGTPVAQHPADRPDNSARGGEIPHGQVAEPGTPRRSGNQPADDTADPSRTGAGGPHANDDSSHVGHPGTAPERGGAGLRHEAPVTVSGRVEVTETVPVRMAHNPALPDDQVSPPDQEGKGFRWARLRAGGQDLPAGNHLLGADDFRQGAGKICGITATAGAAVGFLRAHDQDTLRALVTDSGDGAVTVRLHGVRTRWKDDAANVEPTGQVFEVTVSKDVVVNADGNLAHAALTRERELDAAMVEKAVILAHRAVAGLTDAQVARRGTDDLMLGTNAADEAEIMAMITGRPAHTLSAAQRADPVEAARYLARRAEAGLPVTISSHDPDDPASNGEDLLGLPGGENGHAYRLGGSAENPDGTLELALRNPWGRHHASVTADQDLFRKMDPRAIAVLGRSDAQPEAAPATTRDSLPAARDTSASDRAPAAPDRAVGTRLKADPRYDGHPDDRRPARSRIMEALTGPDTASRGSAPADDPGAELAPPHAGTAAPGDADGPARPLVRHHAPDPDDDRAPDHPRVPASGTKAARPDQPAGSAPGGVRGRLLEERADLARQLRQAMGAGIYMDQRMSYDNYSETHIIQYRGDFSSWVSRRFDTDNLTEAQVKKRLALNDMAELYSYVSDVVGAGVAPAIPGESPAEIYMPYVKGRTIDEILRNRSRNAYIESSSADFTAHAEALAARHAATERGLRIGIFDLITANRYRDFSSWIISDDRRAVPTEYRLSIPDSSGILHDDGTLTKNYGMFANSVTPERLRSVTAGEWDTWQRNLDAQEPLFADKGQGDFYGSMMRRFGQLRLIAEAEPEVAATARKAYEVMRNAAGILSDYEVARILSGDEQVPLGPRSVDEQLAELKREVGSRGASGDPLAQLRLRMAGVAKPLKGGDRWADEPLAYYNSDPTWHLNGEYVDLRDYGYNPPPPDPTQRAAGYTNVYIYHDVDPNGAAFRPEAPVKARKLGEVLFPRRDVAASWAAADLKGALAGPSPLVTVMKDLVDPVDPPGAGRTTHNQATMFRVPRETILDERYYLGPPLDYYKVWTRTNPFWANPDRPYADDEHPEGVPGPTHPLRQH
jgi:hypothetical protein